MIGRFRIDRIIESEGPDFVAHELIPKATPEALAPHRHWLDPHIVDFASGKLVMAMQSYVIRTGRHTIVVDTCVGNDKRRRFHKPWHMRTSTAYLDNLARAGVRLEEVTHVMCTHLHPDHVGWNTRLLDGRWVPTFPNARYVFARTEWEHWKGLFKRSMRAGDHSTNDSVMPIVDAGRADIVGDSHELDTGIWIEPAPGHTPGHIAINIKSEGRHGMLTGDIIHSPIQCLYPDWSTSGCSDPAQSATTRRALLERVCETDTLLMTGHFPSPSVGTVHREADAFRFRFVAES